MCFSRVVNCSFKDMETPNLHVTHKVCIVAFLFLAIWKQHGWTDQFKRLGLFFPLYAIVLYSSLGYSIKTISTEHTAFSPPKDDPFINLNTCWKWSQISSLPHLKSHSLIIWPELLQQVVTYLLHVRHVVVVVAVLHLLWVDIDRLLGWGEWCLGRLRVGARGHGRGRGGQSRVHLLLRRLIGQVQGLGCCCRYTTNKRQCYYTQYCSAPLENI